MLMRLSADGTDLWASQGDSGRAATSPDLGRLRRWPGRAAWSATSGRTR